MVPLFHLMPISESESESCKSTTEAAHPIQDPLRHADADDAGVVVGASAAAVGQVFDPSGITTQVHIVNALAEIGPVTISSDRTAMATELSFAGASLARTRSGPDSWRVSDGELIRLSLEPTTAIVRECE